MSLRLPLRSLAALLLGLAAFVLQGAALCDEAHAAPVRPAASHCAQMAAAGSHHAGDAGEKSATLRHACANACHPPAVAPALPMIAPVVPPQAGHGPGLLAALDGIAPPPATPPPRQG